MRIVDEAVMEKDPQEVRGEAIGMSLESEIKRSLHEDLSVPELIDLLHKFKQAGGSQKEAYKVLEKIRDGNIDESIDDRVLELMDFVSGYCSQDNRIWDEVLIN